MPDTPVATPERSEHALSFRAASALLLAMLTIPIDEQDDADDLPATDDAEAME